MALSSLDHFIDGLEPVPTELQRNFTLMTELDKRTSEIVEKISSDVSVYKKQAKPAERSAIFKDIMNQFDRAKEYSDDKITLAYQTYELIDKHIRRLDNELVKFDRECRERYSLAGQEAAAAAGAAASQDVNKSGSASAGHDSDTQDQVNAPKRRGRKKKFAHSGSESSISGKSDNASKFGKKARRLDSSSLTPVGVATGLVNTPIAGLPGLLTANGEPIAVDMPIDPNEPTYCTCHNVSHGEMIACDNKDCPIEWFHFSCVNLDKKPKGNWYCPQCYNNYKSKRKH